MYTFHLHLLIVKIFAVFSLSLLFPSISLLWWLFFSKLLTISCRLLGPSLLNMSTCISKEQTYYFTFHNYQIQGIWHWYSAIQFSAISPNILYSICLFLPFLSFTFSFFLSFFFQSFPFSVSLSYAFSFFYSRYCPGSHFAFSSHDLSCALSIRCPGVFFLSHTSQLSSNLEFQAPSFLTLPTSVFELFHNEE